MAPVPLHEWKTNGTLTELEKLEHSLHQYWHGQRCTVNSQSTYVRTSRLHILIWI